MVSLFLPKDASQANSQIERPHTSLSRRHMLGCGVLAAGMFTCVPAIATTGVVDVTTMGADPNGVSDSAPAFRAAIAALSGQRGTIMIPAGYYKMESQLDIGTATTPYMTGITFVGAGCGLSILVFTHSNVGLSFVQGDPYQKVSVRDLGFASTANTACAISITMPYADVIGTQSCLIENVDFGMGVGGVTGFLGCLSLTNIWKSTIQNASTNGPLTLGSYFITLGGRSIDNYFVDCQASGVDTAFRVTSYAEGVHLINPTFAGCNCGFSCGTQTFRAGYPQNVLGLTIVNGEFGCFNSAINMYQVWSGSISNTHFGSNNNNGIAPMATMQLNGCFDVHISECQLSGNYNGTSVNQNAVGISLIGVSTAGCGQNRMDSCTFQNLGLAVQYGPGSGWNTATGLRLVGGPTFPSLMPFGVASDSNGANSTNQAEWDTGLLYPNRYKYLH